MSNEFTITRESPAGDVPAIQFHVRGHTMRAEMATGAKLYAELRDPVYTDRNLGPAADLRLTEATGFVLADLIVNGRPEVNITENVADVGAALLWSHWRFVEAERKAKAFADLLAKSSIGAGLADIKERGVDAHLADVEKGKF